MMILIFRDASGRRIVTPDWTVEESRLEGMIVLNYSTVVDRALVHNKTLIALDLDKFIQDMHWAAKHCNGICHVNPQEKVVVDE